MNRPNTSLNTDWRKMPRQPVSFALGRMVLLSEYNVAAPEDVPGSSPPQHFANRSFWRYGECSGSLYSVVV